jgi:hypothetical protein
MAPPAAFSLWQVGGFARCPRSDPHPSTSPEGSPLVKPPKKTGFPRDQPVHRAGEIEVCFPVMTT